MSTPTYMCSGCPAEIATQNIANNRALDPTASGSILLGHMFSDLGPIAAAIQDGARTHTEVIEHMDAHAGGWSRNSDPNDQYGDLTKAEITAAAIGCMLRQANNECTLDKTSKEGD